MFQKDLLIKWQVSYDLLRYGFKDTTDLTSHSLKYAIYYRQASKSRTSSALYLRGTYNYDEEDIKFFGDNLKTLPLSPTSFFLQNINVVGATKKQFYTTLFSNIALSDIRALRFDETNIDDDIADAILSIRGNVKGLVLCGCTISHTVAAKLFSGIENTGINRISFSKANISKNDAAKYLTQIAKANIIQCNTWFTYRDDSLDDNVKSELEEAIANSTISIIKIDNADLLYGLGRNTSVKHLEILGGAPLWDELESNTAISEFYAEMNMDKLTRNKLFETMWHNPSMRVIYGDLEDDDGIHYLPEDSHDIHTIFPSTILWRQLDEYIRTHPNTVECPSGNISSESKDLLDSRKALCTQIITILSKQKEINDFSKYAHSFTIDQMEMFYQTTSYIYDKLPPKQKAEINLLELKEIAARIIRCNILTLLSIPSALPIEISLHIFSFWSNEECIALLKTTTDYKPSTFIEEARQKRAAEKIVYEKEANREFIGLIAGFMFSTIIPSALCIYFSVPFLSSVAVCACTNIITWTVHANFKQICSATQSCYSYVADFAHTIQ